MDFASLHRRHSDQSSQSPDEGELSDRESVQEQEELLEGDQEISAEQSYWETAWGEVIHGLE